MKTRVMKIKGAKGRTKRYLYVNAHGFETVRRTSLRGPLFFDSSFKATRAPARNGVVQRWWILEDDSLVGYLDEGLSPVEVAYEMCDRGV